MSKRVFALLAVLCIALGCLAGCQNGDSSAVTTEPSQTTPETTQSEHIDYAASVTLEDAAPTVKVEATVKNFVDGDTTHFYVPASVAPGGVLKARYLAVNTPESTGKIEAWGKFASNFTKEKLSSATSIMIESDDMNWNVDSTGSRYLVWVWYQPEGSDSYRNLNIELLQEGLSIASSAASNRYGETCMAALLQAKAEQLRMHSKEKDPDFYYGDAIPVTMKGLRTNLELYEGLTVAFEGTVTYNNAQTVYCEDYDEETGMYYGMTVYYGYNLSGTGLEILQAGNRVRFVGSVQYYATGGTWQVSDVKYVDMRPNDPKNLQLISEGNEPSYTPWDAARIDSEKLTMDVLTSLDGEETTEKEFSYSDLCLSTSVRAENLKVTRVYTTTNEDSASKGAMTLTCQTASGETIAVRTAVLHDADGNLITADAYEGKTISVKGIVDYFSGSYQLKVFDAEDITVQ